MVLGLASMLWLMARGSSSFAEEIYSLTLSPSHCSNYLELSEFTFLNWQVCQDILERLANSSSCKVEPIIKVEHDAGRVGREKGGVEKDPMVKVCSSLSIGMSY
jgi:hypothetical protein